MQDYCEISSETSESILQIHKHGGHALSSIPGVEGVAEVVEMGLVFLPEFVMKNLEPFPILCMWAYPKTSHRSVQCSKSFPELNSQLVSHICVTREERRSKSSYLRG